MADDDDSIRIRLEGRLELLEAALARYRLLQLKALDKFNWKAAVRKNAALLREASESEEAVAAALELLERRARAEDWPPRSEALQCAADVRRAREALTRRASKVLGQHSRHHALSDALLTIERRALLSPRLVLPGQRMATAIELLPLTLPGVRELAAYERELERFFKRPEGLGNALPFESKELARLEQLYPKGEAALFWAWSRIRDIDEAGTLTRYLARLARRTPTHAPKNGAEVLLAAEFWKTYGLARLKKLAEARLSPLEVRPHELFAVVRWLCDVERDPAARLSATTSVPRPRAALFELARALTAVTPGQSFPNRGWDRLEALADTAMLDEHSPDVEKLSDNLRLLLRVLSNGKVQRRPIEGETSLLSLVGALRAVAAREV
jgi:hypothetical protein